MNTKCPNCGAVHSLDSLLANEATGDLLAMVAALDADVGRAALRYLGLFRPGKSQLSFARAAKLLGEIHADMLAGRIRREHQEYAAPPAAWLYGFQTALEARDVGRLKLPLKSHGWLYEVMAAWQPQSPHPNPPPQAGEGIRAANTGKPSQTLAAAAQLENLKR